LPKADMRAAPLAPNSYPSPANRPRERPGGPVFAFEIRAAKEGPESQELAFELRSVGSVPETQGRHAEHAEATMACYDFGANGLSSFTPVLAKSAVFRVTRTSSCLCAVAAIWLSREETLMPERSHFALS
jgi:hypothetical protein